MHADSSSEGNSSLLPSVWGNSVKKSQTKSIKRVAEEPKKNHFLGTEEGSLYWFNREDWCGIATATLVWVLLGHCTFIVLWLTYKIDIFSWLNVVAFSFFSMMALWSHFKTMTTNPGAVPHCARVIANDERADEAVTMCAKCDSFKPIRAHHCRICGRCVVRMDHHCPWVNNCVGALNQKSFILFLVYTQCLSIYGLILSGTYFIYCETMDESCVDNTAITITFAPTLLVLSVGAGLFTLAMLFNQGTSVMKGVGTVDRVQRRRKKLSIRIEMTEEEKLFRWQRLFGSGSKLGWFLPVDVVYTDRENARVLGYAIPAETMQRGGAYTSVSCCQA